MLLPLYIQDKFFIWKSSFIKQLLGEWSVGLKEIRIIFKGNILYINILPHRYTTLDSEYFL